MKRVLSAGFLLMGFSFTVTQGLLIRELLVAFYGNELSIGLIVGNWLVLEAIGSGLLGRLRIHPKRTAGTFALLQAGFALLLPLCVMAAFASRSLAGALPGEGVGLAGIWTASLLILAPLGVVAGALFAFGCRAYAHLTGMGAPATGRVYVLEALGAMVGGIAFTYLLIPFLLTLRIVMLLSALNLLAAGLLVVASGPAMARRRTRALALASLVFLLAVCLLLLLSPATTGVQRRAVSRQWPGYALLYSENSAYGNVAVIERESQYTFYADGIPVLTAPVPDVALAEEMVHLPLLFVPGPRRVLVLSGGVGGVLHELAKYPLVRIDYAELDPLLIEAVRQFPTPLTRQELDDPRLRFEAVDGRLMVQRLVKNAGNQTSEGYDLILINLPYPSTLQLNRFYTAEFFQMAGSLLDEGGVLVIAMPSSLSYLSEEVRDLNRMAYHTLRTALPHVRPIPGDVTLWLASPSEALATATLEGPGVPEADIATPSLIQRWQARKVPTQIVTPAHLRLRLAQEALDWFWASLGEGTAVQPGSPGIAQGPDPVRQYTNRDLRPLGLLYGISYWNAIFAAPLARVFAVTEDLNPWGLGLALAACGLALWAVVWRTGRGQRAVVPLAIATTGFAGMAADLMVIFAFQTLYGQVYQQIGLLITAFMGGLALGGLLSTRRVTGRPGRLRPFLILEACLVLYWVLLPVALHLLQTGSGQAAASAGGPVVLLLLSALAGALTGAQFPLANQLWQGRRGVQGNTAGLLYACDLAGAFLGSLLVGVMLMPGLGIVGTCLLVAILKASSLLLVTSLRSRAR